MHLLAPRARKETIKGKTIRNLTLETGIETQLHSDTLSIHFSSPLVSAPLPLHVSPSTACSGENGYIFTDTDSILLAPQPRGKMQNLFQS